MDCGGWFGNAGGGVEGDEVWVLAREDNARV
jgi:hypothetical protein